LLNTELTKQGMKVVLLAHNIISKVEASMTATMTFAERGKFLIFFKYALLIKTYSSKIL